MSKESYCNIDLPSYFDFEQILSNVSGKLSQKDLSNFRESMPSKHENVNYQLVSNKNGKYSWRPFQLIHPAVYVSLVNAITHKDNWKAINDRFQEFQANERIECHSLPVVSKNSGKPSKSSQILTWWEKIEQRSLAIALEYRYVIHTDIQDCYGSIYTHSIPWAIHTKEEAKKPKNRKDTSLIGVSIDYHLQDMNYGQTNGIPQGSVLMDYIAEIVLGYIDLKLSRKLSELNIEDYKILRYRDDYRIFTNDSYLAEQITKVLSEILSSHGFRLNSEKTQASNDIVESSIKDDKRYWIANQRRTRNKQEWLIQIYLLSLKFPNSGTVYKQMNQFLSVLNSSKKRDKNIETLISITTDIGLRNPRVIPATVAILSIFLKKVSRDSLRLEIANKILAKLEQVPNSNYIMIWFQRIYTKINENQDYDIELCRLVNNEDVQIWNSDWLKESMKKVIKNSKIVDQNKLDKLRKGLSTKEIDMIIRNHRY